MTSRRPKRWALIALAVLGAGLIAAPAIFQMFERAPKGARMITAFQPYMTKERLAGYQTEMRQIDAGVREVRTRAAARLAQGDRPFAARFPTFVDFQGRWPRIYADMGGMLTTIQHNRGNYEAVAALPDFRLFPWFFVLPGVLLLLLVGLAALRPASWRTVRWVVAALGVGVALAPAAFQMFDRAPKGGRMVDAFRTIETHRRVETIQGYFGDMAVGQGAVRLEIAPALQATGLSDAQVAAQFPAVTTLNDQWTHVLNDMTPMIGTMSDNVGNYDAVAALPPFPLFPWFFVLPGLIAVGLAFLAGPRRRRRADDVPAPPARDLASPLSEGAP